MTAHEHAFEAVRAAKAVEIARAEVDRLSWLLEEESALMRDCIKDGAQPRWVVVMEPPCTRLTGRTFRCGCSRCNEWTTWTEWFNDNGYYEILFRQFRLERLLDAARDALSQATTAARTAAKEARHQARILTGLDE